MESRALHIDELPGLALVAHPDGSILGANPHVERLFAFEPGSMVGLQFKGLLQEEHREEWLQRLESILGDGPESSVQYGHVSCSTGDGRELTVDIAAGVTADGSVGILIRDVTAEQRTEAERREEEQRFRFGALHITDVVQYVDVLAGSLDWYGDLEALLGYEPGTFPHTLRYRHLRDRGSFVSYVDGRGAQGVGGIMDETDQVVARQELEAALAEVAALKDRLQAESHYLQSEIASIRGFEEIVGHSGTLKEALAQVKSVSHTNATVLLLGETGTGKELLARAIHRHSARSNRPLIRVDCGTLPAGLVESELFGHEKGSFTGALDQKTGRFELAHAGTILLDEIGELPLELQAKLLRAIEEGEFRRVGGENDITVDVRIIAATNRDLRTEVREGRFRADLYYRLSVFPITAPPLRERREDIPDLVSFFVTKYAAHLGKPIRGVTESSLDAMLAYDWPGNIRELRNVIERSVILCAGETLAVAPSLLGASEPAIQTGGSLKEDLHGLERARILRALEESGWKIKGDGNTASRLGIAPSTLRSRMRTLGITRPG